MWKACGLVLLAGAGAFVAGGLLVLIVALCFRPYSNIGWVLFPAWTLSFLAGGMVAFARLRSSEPIRAMRRWRALVIFCFLPALFSLAPPAILRWSSETMAEEVRATRIDRRAVTVSQRRFYPEAQFHFRRELSRDIDVTLRWPVHRIDRVTAIDWQDADMTVRIEVDDTLQTSMDQKGHHTVLFDWDTGETLSSLDDRPFAPKLEDWQRRKANRHPNPPIILVRP